MKKVFEDDSSYIEINNSKKGNNVIVSLCSKDPVKENQVVMISIEIDRDELLNMITTTE